MEISFTDSVIRLYKEKPKGYDRKISVTYDIRTCPYIQGNAAGVNTPFLLDTGSPSNILFPLPSANYIDQSKYQRIITSDAKYESYRVNLSYFDDGFRIYKNITGNSNPLSTLNNGLIYSREGNIGVDYLKQFDLAFDYRGYSPAYLYYRRRSLSERLSTGRKGCWNICGRKNAQYNKYGIDYWFRDNDRLYVVAVLENSAATNAEIIPGTEVLQINNKDAKQYSPRKLNDLFLISDKKLVLQCMINNEKKEVVFQ